MDIFSIGKKILEKQPFSVFMGAELITLEQGKAVILLEIKENFLQQNGFVHGGVISYLVDNAITFAGGSVLGEDVLTLEYKVNYLKPAMGKVLLATAWVESYSKKIAVCKCRVDCKEDEREICCALAQGTIILVR